MKKGLDEEKLLVCYLHSYLSCLKNEKIKGWFVQHCFLQSLAHT